MKLLKITSLTIFLFTSGMIYSQEKTISYLYDAEAQPVGMIVDIIHLKAELEIDPFEQKVDGISYYTFKTFHMNTDSIVFDIPDIEIISADIDGVEANYKSTGDK